MADNYVVIQVWPTNIRTGLWCTTCALPSRIDVDLATMSEHGVTVIGSAEWCDECESDDGDTE